MKILGIDPGLRITGYGCIEIHKKNITIIEAGAIKLNIKENISFRLEELHRNITEVICDLTPNIIAIETIFTHPKRVTAATILGYARGVLLLAGQQASLPLLELTPATVKKAIAGNGRATKEQMQLAVANILRLPEPPQPTDVADALAIAITAALRKDLKNTM